MATYQSTAGPGAEVSFATASGSARCVVFDARGLYSTTDYDEIAVLDAMADEPGSLIQRAADAAATGRGKTATTTTTITDSEVDDVADR